METLRVAVCDDDRVYLEQIKEEIKEYIGSMPGTVDMQVSLLPMDAGYMKQVSSSPLTWCFWILRCRRGMGSGWQSSWALAVRRPGLYCFQS